LKADLHIHTRLSNGSMGLEEILGLARLKGIETIAITDHDCISGAARAKQIGSQYNVNVISGTEFSSVDDATGELINILCYAPEVTDRLEGVCRQNRTARKMVYTFLIKEICQDYPVTKTMIERCYTGSTCIYKQHIMNAMVECGIAESFYGEIHDSIFGPGCDKKYYIKPKFASTSEIIKLIHASGGVAVLAHPLLYKDDTLLDRMKKLGIDGIEVWHPSCTEAESNTLFSYASGQKLLMTGGSDFHGLYNKTCNTIGSYGVPDAQLTEFLKFKEKIRRQMKKDS